MNIILLVSTFLLFVFFTQGGVNKCYRCEGSCRKLEEEICDSDENSTTEYLCQASSQTFIISYAGKRKVDSSRKCVPDTEHAKLKCKYLSYELDMTCYTCDTDLCNKIIQIEEEVRNEQTEPATTTTEGNFKECYVCEDDCKNPQKEKCNIEDTTDYLCMAMATTKKGITKHSRRCVRDTEEDKKDCEVVNEKKDGACYTCESDLCNDRDPISEKNKHPDVPVNKHGVKECYSCPKGPCKFNKVVSCHTIELKYLCQAAHFKLRNGTEIDAQQCMENSKEVEYECLQISLGYGDSCYTCKENLCNHKVVKKNYSGGLDLEFLKVTTEQNIPDEENYSRNTKKCLFCYGTCKKPQIQTCDIKNYICQEREFTKYSETTYERTCVQNTHQARRQCAFYNEQRGSRCYTCDKDRCNDKYLPVEKGTYPAPVMLLTILISLFLIKL